MKAIKYVLGFALALIASMFWGEYSFPENPTPEAICYLALENVAPTAMSPFVGWLSWSFSGSAETYCWLNKIDPTELKRAAILRGAGINLAFYIPFIASALITRAQSNGDDLKETA